MFAFDVFLFLVGAVGFIVALCMFWKTLRRMRDKLVEVRENPEWLFDPLLGTGVVMRVWRTYVKHFGRDELVRRFRIYEVMLVAAFYAFAFGCLGLFSHDYGLWW